MSDNYWNGVLRGRVSRRRALAATTAGAAAAAFLAACGGGGDGEGGQATQREVPDPTSGKVGGKLIWQSYGDPGGGLEMIKIRNPGVHQMASLTHDGLTEFAYGIPKYPGIGREVLPALAAALPEVSPDKLTLTYKLRQGAKFHNGREVTAEDAKWTYDTGAFAPESAWRNDLPFIEKTEAPDKYTFVVKTKYPYADVIQSMTQKNFGSIMAREHHESGAAEKSLMGSGAFLFVEYQPPLITRYKRNPDYHTKPFPYFNEIDRIGTSDSEKKIADIISKAVHLTYWFPAEERDRVRQGRPDALMFKYPRAGSGTVYIRNDKPPFNDKRVRQALSMSIDRKAAIAAVSANEGEPDQALSHSATDWGFRKPSAFPAAIAKYWNYDVAEAKKLLAAAGVTLPIKVDIPTWNPTVIGQKHVDEITLYVTQWRNNGILDARLVEENFGQYAPRLTGTYDHLTWGPNVTSTLPDIGIALRNKYFWPAGGIAGPPTLNLSYVNIPRLSELVEKQLGQFDTEARKQTFKEIEEILAEEMVHVVGVSGTLTWFADPSLKNVQMPRDAYNGGVAWMKYWWFG